MTQPSSDGEPLVTGEAVALELRPAGVGSRGLALVIDLAIQYVLVLLLVWAVAALGGSLDTAAVVTVILLVFVGLVLGYPVGFETLMRGRTPGKAALGLRVVRDDGGPIRFRHALVRGLVGVVLDRPGLSSGLLALVPMLTTKRSKRLGDLAAGTIVVQERVSARLAPPPPMPAGLESWAANLDLSRLTDDVALQTRTFLARAAQLAPWARDEMGARLYAELTARVGPPPPDVPPWAYFSAVLAERRRRELDRLAPVAATPAAATPTAPMQAPQPELPAGPFAPPS